MSHVAYRLVVATLVIAPGRCSLMALRCVKAAMASRRTVFGGIVEKSLFGKVFASCWTRLELEFWKLNWYRNKVASFKQC